MAARTLLVFALPEGQSLPAVQPPKGLASAPSQTNSTRYRWIVVNLAVAVRQGDPLVNDYATVVGTTVRRSCFPASFHPRTRERSRHLAGSAFRSLDTLELCHYVTFIYHRRQQILSLVSPGDQRGFRLELLRRAGFEEARAALGHRDLLLLVVLSIRLVSHMLSLRLSSIRFFGTKPLSLRSSYRMSGRLLVSVLIGFWYRCFGDAVPFLQLVIARTTHTVPLIENVFSASGKANRINVIWDRIQSTGCE